MSELEEADDMLQEEGRRIDLGREEERKRARGRGRRGGDSVEEICS